MKSILITLLKVVLPVLIIGWLLSRLEPEQVRMLRDQPKRWWLLLAAFVVTFGAVSLTFVRWWLLVVGLGMRFRLRDAFRLGFMGFLFNFISAGSVGGDLFKAVFAAREQPRRRAEAVATVLVDRVVGLYALILVASAGILIGGIPPSGPVRIVCQTTLVCAAVGAAGIALLLSPLLTEGRLASLVGELPLVGRMLAKVISSVRLYKSRPDLLLAVAACGMGAHLCLSVGIAFIAWGAYPQAPTLLEHFVIVPLSMVANGLPLTPGGLGAMEAAMDELYRIVPAGSPAVSGVLVALMYRITTLAIAGVGAVFYVAGRGEMEQVLREAEQDGDPPLEKVLDEAPPRRPPSDSKQPE